MPPFSGKKKKEQLQAKRQRKRDDEERSNALERERERLREELVNRGEEVNDDVLDAYMRERHPHQRDPVRGRHAHRKEREQQKTTAEDGDDNTRKRNSHGRATKPNEDSGEDDDEECAETGQKNSRMETLMYSADRQHGVRSVFAKESPAVLAARKQLSYKPIPFRTTMPATGIPFGEWFTFPSQASAATTHVLSRAEEEEAAARRTAAEKANLIAAEQERRLDRPLVATTAEALGGGSGSVVFPFAVELPSRGWHVRRDERGKPADADEGNAQAVAGSLTGGPGAEVEVESNTLTAPAGVAAVPDVMHPISQEAVDGAAAAYVAEREKAVEKNVKTENAAAPSSSSSPSASSSSSSTSEGGEGEEEGKVRKTASTNADARRAEALFIKRIEQKRFDAYVRCLDAYPLPSALEGLDISSYERNVEVWQQLWRTVELSDVLVVVADARYPILHAHLGLLTYITKEQRKPCVFVLNKEDLVPASTLRCWLQFLHLYLTDLGFNVEAPDGRGEEEEATTKSNSTRVNADAREPREAYGKIVLRTFTANPRPETAGQRDGEVDVTRRQKHRKGTDAKMYEKLRTGKLNATKHLGRSHRSGKGGSDGGSDDGSSSDADDSSDDSEDNLRYSANENFVGMQAAEHALLHDRRAYKELEVVAKKITELLGLCRRLGAAGRAARGGAAAVAASSTAAAPAAGAAYATSALPCPAPKAAPKNKKAQKRSGARQGNSKNHHTRNSGKGGGSFAEGQAETNTDGDSEDGVDAVEDRAPDSPAYVHIGFIGHPNVGKSSLLNCIRGTKVVSVSATPGHTKHVQTIPVPEEQLTLVDSPGLALPVFGVPRPLQAVLGTHQIAQTRDPQSGVSFLAAYLPIEKLYGLQRPDYAMAEDEWSSYELCEAYAKKRGYYVKHGKGALDIHRAAIAILQEAYEGRLALFYAPPELNLLQSAWYRERLRPHLLLTVFGASL